jgi:hypothetical protein
MLILKRKGWVPDTTSPTNLLSRVQSDAEAGSTGLTAYTGSTLTRITTDSWQGNACLQVETPGAAASEGFLAIASGVSGQIGDTFTVSAYLKGSGNVQLLLTRDSSAASPITAIELTDQWTRYSATGTFASAGTPRLYVRTPSAQAITFYADGMMIEKAATLGRWVPGQTRRIRRRLIL